jgi:hypothetical protein
MTGAVSVDREVPQESAAARWKSIYQGETWMLDSPEGVCAGQVLFEYPATSVLFSNFRIYGPARLAKTVSTTAEN